MNTTGRSNNTQKVLFLAIVFALSMIVFTIVPPQAVDWFRVFYKVSKIPLHPYDEVYFISSPFTAVILYPFHFFPANISLAINSSLNLVIIGSIVFQRKGDKIALLLTLTSFPFLSLIANGNIEWVPAIGFLLQNQWSIPFFFAKPQSGILSALAWIHSRRQFFIFAGIATALLLFSFLVWGNWPISIQANTQKIGITESSFNMSPFPWAVPLGIGLIYYMLRYNPDNKELIGTLATFCVTPYFGNYSLIIPFSLISVRHRRTSIVLWVLLWLYPLVANWNILIELLSS